MFLKKRILGLSILAILCEQSVLAEQTQDYKENQIATLPTIELKANQAPSHSQEKVTNKTHLGILGETDLLTTPFSVQSYTSEYIQDRQAQSISSLISAIDPAVYTSGSTGNINETFNIRGMSVDIRDVSINGLYGMAPYWRISPEFAERVEVLKGPSALLNGISPNGSVGGNVNIVTKRANASPLTRLTTSYYSDAKFGGQLDIGRRFGEKKQFGIRLNSAYRDGDTAVDHQQSQTKLAALGLDWQFDQGNLSADLYYSEDHVDGVNRGIPLSSTSIPVPQAPKSTILLAPSDTYSTTKDKGAMLHGDYQLTNHIGLYANYGHAKTDFDALASSTYNLLNAAGDFSNNFSHQRLTVDKDSANAGLKFDFNTGNITHQLSLDSTYYHHNYGLAFRRNFLTTNWVTNIYSPNWDGLVLDKSFSGTKPSKTAEVKNVGYGIADNMKLLDDRLNWIMGVRHQNVVSDTFDSTSGARTAHYDQSATTPAIALSYKIFDQLSVYGNYIEGLSAGSTAPNTASNAGEVFPPYKTKQYEVGLKSQFKQFINTVSLFEIKKPSAITDTITNTYSVGGEQRNKGIEWSFLGNISKALNIMGGVSYTDASLTKTSGGVNQGKKATAVPEWQGKLTVDYTIPQLETLHLTAGISSLSKQYINADNTLSVPGRTIFDLGGQYSIQLGNIPTKFNMTLQNVMNKAYWAGSLNEGLGAPRTLLASATFDF